MVYTLSYQMYKCEHGLSAAEQRAADVRAGEAAAAVRDVRLRLGRMFPPEAPRPAGPRAAAAVRGAGSRAGAGPVGPVREMTMQYMLIHAGAPGLDDAWNDEAWAALTAWLDEAISSGVSIEGAPLRLDADATTVKVRDGQLIVTDGPYAETKEQVAGYDVIECASLEEAVRWARRHPHSWMGAVEVRALAGGSPAVHLPGPAAGKTRYMMLGVHRPGGRSAGARPHGAGRALGRRDGRPGRPLFGSSWSRPAVPARSGAGTLAPS